MDLAEAVVLLRGGPKGLADWNERRKSRENIPSLRGANLSGSNLREAQLLEADLRGADLRGADLGEADLRGADLRKAYINGACLSGAYLQSAILSFSDLRKANLSRAKIQDACLRKADLREADLRGADLREADLRGAVLSRAYLSGAGLGRAQLLDADLCGADLRVVDLREADLRGAVLRDAKLRDAILHRADFGGANLSGADLTYALCLQTSFSNNDLSHVRGLDSLKHDGPSTVGIDTLFRSEGKIPEIFLRGCGVPETLIVQHRALVGSLDPIQFYSCFISHCSADRDLAERLHADLQQKGVRCWYAEKDLRIGDRFRPRIDEAIRVHEKLLLLISEKSAKSQEVENEVEAAMDREKSHGLTVLFPIRLDETALNVDSGWPALVRRTRHIGDFTHWRNHEHYQKAFDRLLPDLRALRLYRGQA